MFPHPAVLFQNKHSSQQLFLGFTIKESDLQPVCLTIRDLPYDPTHKKVAPLVSPCLAECSLWVVAMLKKLLF